MFMIVFRAGYLIIKLHNISHSTCKCRVKQHKRTCTCIENKITFSILYTKGPTVPLIGTSYTKLTLMQFLNWLLALVLKSNLTRFVVKCQISTSGGPLFNHQHSRFNTLLAIFCRWSWSGLRTKLIRFWGISSMTGNVQIIVTCTQVPDMWYLCTNPSLNII